MTTEQKEQIQFGIDFAMKHIQEIEASSDDLCTQIARVEFQLVLLLDDVVEALPKALRVQAQACIQAKNQLRNTLMREIDSQIAKKKTQKEASPLSANSAD